MQSLPCDCGRNLCKVILRRFPQILQGLGPIEIRCVYHHYGILFIYFDLQGDQHPLLSPLRLPVPPSRLRRVLLERPLDCTAHIGPLNTPTPLADFVLAPQSTAVPPERWRLHPDGSLL